MNVLCYAPQMAAYGGMERHACGLAAALAQNGHHVRLLTTSNSLGPELRALLRTANVDLHELPRARGHASRLRKMGWLWRQTRAARRLPWDVIYTNGQSALASLPWAARSPDTRIIHHHHTSADRAERRTWSRQFRKTLTRAPEIVACSRATRDELNRTLGRNDVHFLPYLTRDALGDGTVSDRIYDQSSRLHFGFIGRLVAEKGIARMCALSNHPALRDVHWHIHGSGDDFPASHFSTYPNITYHGSFTGREAQARVLQSLDALVLLSRHNEGMPLSLIEAMSAGLPWLATAQGGTREIAISAEDTQLVPGDASDEQLAEAVAAFARRIRAGDTSRVRQREAYDRQFAPAGVAASWQQYFTGAPAPRTAPDAACDPTPQRAFIR